MLRITMAIGAFLFLMSELMRVLAHEIDAANAGVQLLAALLLSIGFLAVAFGPENTKIKRNAGLMWVGSCFLLAFLAFDLLGYGRTSLFLHHDNYLFWATHLGLAASALVLAFAHWQTRHMQDWHPAPLLLALTTLLFVGARLQALPLNWQFVTSLLWSFSLLFVAANRLNDRVR
ncbi:hypothetical protein MXMO3_00380 [Maritalea myrionectae]|uniref:Uncharacterized protein n=1 Tax=Maritalea myrionectae TaxID=454601 RepID=A0A2R4MA55_9HYPH|nr:hypothetical protein [Maritalea myrionectae]AVX02927.1 hypothetical protein MXMO3_00380 [Maritalea myrionectae]